MDLELYRIIFGYHIQSKIKIQNYNITWNGVVNIMILSSPQLAHNPSMKHLDQRMHEKRELSLRFKFFSIVISPTNSMLLGIKVDQI